MNSYRFETSGPENTSYYGPYAVNDELMRMDYNRRAWEYPSVMNMEEPTVVDMPSEEVQVPTMQAIPEECELQFLFSVFLCSNSKQYNRKMIACFISRFLLCS